MRIEWALSIGVATVANKKAPFLMVVDRIPWFDASFFAEFNWLAVLTSPLDAYISRYGDFCANDNIDINNDGMTDCFTPCVCARGNKVTELVQDQ